MFSLVHAGLWLTGEQCPAKHQEWVSLNILLLWLGFLNRTQTTQRLGTGQNKIEKLSVTVKFMCGEVYALKSFFLVYYPFRLSSVDGKHFHLMFHV